MVEVEGVEPSSSKLRASDPTGVAFFCIRKSRKECKCMISIVFVNLDYTRQTPRITHPLITGVPS